MATVAAGSAFAQSPRAPAAVPTPAAQPRIATTPAQAGGVRVSPAANEAVQVVNSFMAALVSGQLEAARQLMAPDAVVIANGNVLGKRDAYIDGAAKGDAAALRSVQRELLHRDVKAAADVSWVISEKRLRAAGAATGPSEVVTETMLLAKTARGLEDHPHPLVGPTRRLTLHRGEVAASPPDAPAKRRTLEGVRLAKGVSC